MIEKYTKCIESEGSNARKQDRARWKRNMRAQVRERRRELTQDVGGALVQYVLRVSSLFYMYEKIRKVAYTHVGSQTVAGIW